MDGEPARGVIVAQWVTPIKLERARELRRRRTPEEAALWAALRRPRWDGLPFRRQQVIDGFLIDFYCHAARLVVEVDGSVHDDQVEYDRERDRILAGRGLRLLRVRNEEVAQQLADVLARIRTACRQPMAPGLAGDLPRATPEEQ